MAQRKCGLDAGLLPVGEDMIWPTPRWNLVEADRILLLLLLLLIQLRMLLPLFLAAPAAGTAAPAPARVFAAAYIVATSCNTCSIIFLRGT